MIDQICADDRFAIISMAKNDLLKKTNIESSEDEMKVLYPFLFRCWQMGWLDKYSTMVFRRPCKDRYPEVLQAAEIVTEKKLTKERCRLNTNIRAFVAYRLKEEGYSYREIGAMMMRDHSSVTHLTNRMRDMLSLPNVYREEIELYRQFENLITNGKEE